MKCRNLFSRKNKKTITDLLSAQLAQNVVKVNDTQNNVSDFVHLSIKGKEKKRQESK